MDFQKHSWDTSLEIVPNENGIAFYGCTIYPKSVIIIWCFVPNRPLIDESGNQKVEVATYLHSTPSNPLGELYF